MTGMPRSGALQDLAERRECCGKGYASSLIDSPATRGSYL